MIRGETKDASATSALTPDKAAQAFNPFEGPHFEDPYPLFTTLRAQVPVFYAQQIDHWVVSRHDDIKRVFLDPKTFSCKNALTPIHPLNAKAQHILEQGGFRMTPAFGNNDRPEHTRFRKHVQSVFTPQYLKDHEPRIAQIIGQFIDQIEPEGEADFAQQFLPDLSATVMLDMLGFAPDEMDLLLKGGKERVLYIWGKPSVERQNQVAQGLATLFRYCRRLVEDRQLSPKDDLASRIVHGDKNSKVTFTPDELASILFAFFTAGHDTTSSTMANALHQLLSNRSQWEIICKDPSLIPGAVEEVLRFDSPVVGWRRKATQEVDINGTTIPAGGQILLLLGSGNRDETIFENADHFNITRPNAHQHLSFGKGIHTCLGNTLSRMEIRIVLEQLSRRLPQLRLKNSGVEVGIPAVIFHGVTHLPVTWT